VNKTLIVTLPNGAMIRFTDTQGWTITDGILSIFAAIPSKGIEHAHGDDAIAGYAFISYAPGQWDSVYNPGLFKEHVEKEWTVDATYVDPR